MGTPEVSYWYNIDSLSKILKSTRRGEAQGCLILVLKNSYSETF